MINRRKNKGITLISLVITIAIMLILSGVVAYNFSVSNEKSYYNKMVSDIELLNDKILVYYNKYDEIPKTSRAITLDGKTYYEIDLSKLEGITLNYGIEYGGTGTLSETLDLYVVDEDLTVYYLKGVELNNTLYHTGSYGVEVVPQVILSTTAINKTISSGGTATVSLTATLNNASGDLTWESSDGDVAEISGSGTTRTITLKKAGTATITVSYGTEASATCSITITEKEENQEYAMGEEVIVGGESFFVIGVNGQTLTLLAKYNLNKAGTQQLNDSLSSTACKFASTNYWSSETDYPLDLNTYPIPEGVTSIIATAKAYGEAKGGTGRLLTYEEAKSLVGSYSGIISGKAYTTPDGGINFHLSSASSSTYTYRLKGDSVSSSSSDWFYSTHMNVSSLAGCRPVIEIDISAI